MKKFAALLRVSFRGMLLTANPTRKNRKKAATGAGFLVLMCCLMLYLGGVYSFVFASLLAPLGRLDLMLSLMALIGVSMSFFLGVASGAGFVFGGRDNDILLAMPVSAFAVLLSKVLALYLENLALMLFVLLPAGAAYLRYAGFAAAFLPLLLLGALLLPLLPTAASLVLGFLFSFLQSRARHKALLSNLLYLGFFAVIFALSFGLSGVTGASSATSSVTAALSGAVGWAVPLVWFGRALCCEALLMLPFAAVCLGSFFLVVWLFSLGYKNILTRLLAVQVRSDYRMGALRADKALPALCKKELRRLFGTPIYLMNTCFGGFLLLGGGIYVLVSGRISDILSQLPPGADKNVVGALALIVCFCTMLTSTTAPSISLEGGRLWILRESPVSTGEIFAAKILTNLIVMFPPVLIGVPAAAVGCGLSFAEGLLLTVLGLVSVCFAALLGLALNLVWPRLDLVNDTAAVKRGVSVMVQVFGTFAVLAAGYGLWRLLAGPLSTVGALWCCAALLVLFCLVLLAVLRGWGQRAFAELLG